MVQEISVGHGTTHVSTTSVWIFHSSRCAVCYLHHPGHSAWCFKTCFDKSFLSKWHKTSACL